MRDSERLTHRLRNLLTVVQGAADANVGEDYQLISEASRAAEGVLRRLEEELDVQGLDVPVRAATRGDLPGILEVLNREIEQGFAHFGTEAQSLEELERAFEEAAHPWLVAADDRGLLGFVRAGPWKSRGGYSWTVETGST